MPKFMKDSALMLLDGGIESYLLGLYGLTLPSTRLRRKQETRYAPVMGLFGAAVELIVKACLVQAKGLLAMYKNGDVSSGVYKFGSEVLDEFQKEIREDSSNISFVWKSQTDKDDQKEQLIFYLKKFRLLQDLRANGLHAGIGCSRDVAVLTANDIYQFILLLSQGKKLKAYLKNIPAPESTVRDREAIIEDLSRRLTTRHTVEDKIGCLRNMYLVLPYIPEMEPDWIKPFEKTAIVPPTVNDVNYLVKTLTDAHNIYLLKNRGGKDGVPVRVEPENPNALPIAIQNIKRTLSTIPDQFNNDILTANTRLEQKRLDLPIDDFLLDLFALGLENAKVLQEGTKLTAQQAWPFVASGFSSAGTPRPCWEFVQKCDELDKLLSFLTRSDKIGNGYFSRRSASVIKCVNAIKNGSVVDLGREKDGIFGEIKPYVQNYIKKNSDNPFTPAFIRRYPLPSETSEYLREFVAGNLSAGNALERILNRETLDSNERKAAIALIKLCSTYENRNGLVAVLRTKHLSGYHSEARKIMFFIDSYHFGAKLF